MTQQLDRPTDNRLLEVLNVEKSYGGVQAIARADLVVRKGTVHGLIGANGAGKSTLIKIISGAVIPDSGTFTFDGAPQQFGSTKDAMSLGIETVYQEPNLLPDLTVAENMFIGKEIIKAGRIDWASTDREASSLLDRMGLPRRLSHRRVGELSIAQQQLISIAKALAQNVKFLILDEPSAILTDLELQNLFEIIKDLASSGQSVLYVSHRLDEIERIAHEVTIMRDGITVAKRQAPSLNVSEMVRIMLGENPEDQTKRSEAEARPRKMSGVNSPTVLELDDAKSAEKFENVSLKVRSGEIVCLFGLTGSGAVEITRSMYGLDQLNAGNAILNGKRYSPRSPIEAQQNGVTMLPGNRKGEGLFGHMSIAFNTTISHLKFLSRWKIIFDRKRENMYVDRLISQLAIKAEDRHVPVNKLSGGNAQKVMFARQLLRESSLLILIEPTQGVDIGAKEEIHKLIEEAAASGTAVLISTTDHTEAVRLGDRLIVLRAGQIVGQFDSGVGQAQILEAASGDSVEVTK